MSITAIITAAGKGLRAGFKENKILQPLRGKDTVLYCSVEPFLSCKDIDEIIITSSAEDMQRIKEIFAGASKPVVTVLGGDTRSDSVKNALACVKSEYVLIHDGARPYLSESLLKKCIDGILGYGSCAPVIPCTDTIADVCGDKITCSSRSGKMLIQTPQCFKTQEILRAFKLKADGETFTDEVGLYCKYISDVHAVDGEKENVKLTYKEDFCPSVTCGTGFDLHKLVEGRKLILGGVEIPHSKGLLGHSDADVLTHAIMDALLSACSLRDIGYHFSDKDEQYKDISSMILLDRVLNMLKQEGYKPLNVTAVIMAEKPKLSPYIEAITQNLASALRLPVKQVGITATTLEGIGIVGREEGIATQAYCSVERIHPQ